MRKYPVTRRSVLKYIGILAGGRIVHYSPVSQAGTSIAARDRLTDSLEQATRERAVEETIQQIKGGLAYTDLLAVLTRAAAGNIQPWPDVGYKYHNVMVLQSLHLAAQALPLPERWFPLIWQVDYFKRSQAIEKRRTGWRMQPVRARPVGPRQAKNALVAALQAWDREAADIAAVQMLAATGPLETVSLLLPYFVRDFRELGHKPIAGANALRMLQITGGYAGEELVRSAVAAIGNPGRHGDPAAGDYRADRAWRQNIAMPARFPRGWRRGRTDWGAGSDLLRAMHTVTDLEAAGLVRRFIQDKISPQVLWEALLGAAAEMMLRTGSFAALHANTMANSAYYLYRSAGENEAGRLLLLQTASLLALFRENIGTVRRQVSLESLEPLACNQIDECFTVMNEGRYRAVRMALGYLQQGGSEEALVETVRRYTVYYTGNSHDYKYTEAILEDHRNMTSPWRLQHLSTVMLWANGPHQPLNPVIEQAQAMIGKV